MSHEIVFYKDLDLALSPNPLTGDIIPKTNADAIRRALKQLLLMEKWDRPFDSNIHGHTTESLFELPTALAINSVTDKIKWVIKSFEYRVDVIEVDVELSSDETEFNVTVKYKVKSLGITESTSFTIQRVR